MKHHRSRMSARMVEKLNLALTTKLTSCKALSKRPTQGFLPLITGSPISTAKCEQKRYVTLKRQASRRKKTSAV